MPCYEYECDNCHLIIELFRPVSDRHRKVICDTCGRKLKFLLSTSSFNFVGPGFYKTDYKK